MSSFKDIKFSDISDLLDIVKGDRNASLNVIVSRMLFLMGFRNNLIGTAYLKDAILLLYNLNAGIKINLCKEIYSKVAERNCSTVNRVERDIRHCIQDCYNRGKLFAFNALVHCEIVTKDYTITNSELLKSIVSWLRMEIRKDTDDDDN